MADKWGTYYVTFTKRDGTTDVKRVPAPTRQGAITTVKCRPDVLAVSSAIKIG